MGIAGQIDVPIIAIADPGVEEDTKINIAWYTGGAGQKLQDSITTILNSLSVRISGELLLVGGSGGGFAALYYASRLRHSCSVFVWNPQTDVFKYIDKFVRPYLNGLFKYSMSSLSGLDWIERTRKRAAFHADLTILENNHASIPRRLFYLQNATDWHAREHLKPFLIFNDYRPTKNGMYQTDEDHVCLVTHAAPGHLPPPVEMIKAIISMMENPGTSSLQIAQKVQTMVAVVHDSSNEIPTLL